tara:strand:+ start:210 stop:1223 length:1014 start_codon:yes stop_codon:yes gene_type:complete
MKNILVTGGAGSIGSNLVKKLIDKDDTGKIVILDNFSSGFMRNLSDIENNNKLIVINGSICNDESIEKAFAHSIDQVYHLAVNFANQSSVDNPEKDLMTNGIGTIKILEAAKKYKVNKFLLAGSSCVYKPGKEKFIEHGPIELTTPYAITKMLSEYYVTFFNKYHNMDCVIVRYFNSYGPCTHPGKFRGVVPNFFWDAMHNKPLVVTGTGEETRPFTFVDDVVEGTILAMNETDHVKLDKFFGHPLDKNDNIVYNIGNSNSITIKALAEKINIVCNNSAGIKYIPKRDWDVIPHRSVDANKAKNKFGFNAKFDIDIGLQLTYMWLKENFNDITYEVD